MRVKDETWGGDTGQVHQVRFGSSQIRKLGVWDEFDYRVDMCRAYRRGHIEYLLTF